MTARERPIGRLLARQKEDKDASAWPPPAQDEAEQELAKCADALASIVSRIQAVAAAGAREGWAYDTLANLASVLASDASSMACGDVARLKREAGEARQYLATVGSGPFFAGQPQAARLLLAIVRVQIFPTTSAKAVPSPQVPRASKACAVMASTIIETLVENLLEYPDLKSVADQLPSTFQTKAAAATVTLTRLLEARLPGRVPVGESAQNKLSRAVLRSSLRALGLPVRKTHDLFSAMDKEESRNEP
jgi:hypothetical protein